MTGLLLIEDVAALLQVKKATVHEWVCQRSIPHRKIGGKRRLWFDEGDLRAWLDGGVELEERKLPKGGRIVRPKTVGRR